MTDSTARLRLLLPRLAIVGVLALTAVALACSGEDDRPAPTAAAVFQTATSTPATASPTQPPIVVASPEPPQPAPPVEVAPTATPIRPAPTAPVSVATPTPSAQPARPIAAATVALPPPPAPIPEGPLMESISLADQSFTPHQIHGNAKQLVIVTLSGGTERHTFTIDSLNVDVSIPANSQTTVRFVVPVDGISTFYCKVHGSPNSGMHGLLIFH